LSKIDLTKKIHHVPETSNLVKNKCVPNQVVKNTPYSKIQNLVKIHCIANKAILIKNRAYTVFKKSIFGQNYMVFQKSNLGQNFSKLHCVPKNPLVNWTIKRSVLKYKKLLKHTVFKIVVANIL
jgi:hypothetical protein